jgi:K+:H+ antiporter
VSRRAAEVAIAVAQASGCRVAALYVAQSTTSKPRKRRGFRLLQQEQAIMKDFVEMADRYDVAARTAVRADLAPDNAILTEAKEGQHDLIIMGVSRRPGDRLFFGETAAAVLEKSAASIVFVAT